MVLKNDRYDNETFLRNKTPSVAVSMKTALRGLLDMRLAASTASLFGNLWQESTRPTSFAFVRFPSNSRQWLTGYREARLCRPFQDLKQPWLCFYTCCSFHIHGIYKILRDTTLKRNLRDTNIMDRIWEQVFWLCSTGYESREQSWQTTWSRKQTEMRLRINYAVSFNCLLAGAECEQYDDV